MCDKKFRNNHSKGEYPARGSFICHWATEHGKVDTSNSFQWLERKALQ